MERLSANFFFDDYIVRAGSPEAAAALLLAELRQAPEMRLAGQCGCAERRLFAVAYQSPSCHPDWSRRIRGGELTNHE